jgi:pimeloyl-ACP methyl ester carboxylesterase
MGSFFTDGGRDLRCPPAILLLTLLCSAALWAQPVDEPAPVPAVAVHPFASAASPPPYQPPDDLRGAYARLRPLLRTVPEVELVKLGLEFGLTHGRVTEPQREQLEPRLEQVYARIAEDPAWADVPSCLPFCFDDQREGGGQYLMVTPPDADAASPVVVFLHGHAGNFQSQVYLLSRQLPEAIILAPSWTGSWAQGRAAYIDDMLKDAGARLGFKPTRPTLIGLADGALAAFHIAGRRPQTYGQLISLAMTPRQSHIRALPESLPVLMINGTNDDRIQIDHARLRAKALAAHLDRFESVELDAGHFFLLTHPDATTKAVRRFLFGQDDPAQAPATP